MQEEVNQDQPGASRWKDHCQCAKKQVPGNGQAENRKQRRWKWQKRPDWLRRKEGKSLKKIERKAAWKADHHS